MAGNGTAGLEILEDLPNVDAVLVPFGGGGLSCGISSALRQKGSPARVHPVEVTTSAKVVAAVRHGAPQWIDTEPSFVDGIGGNTVLEPMWPLVQELLDEPLLASPEEIADAVRILAGRSRIVAEGAGASPVAVALAGGCRSVRAKRAGSAGSPASFPAGISKWASSGGSSPARLRARPADSLRASLPSSRRGVAGVGTSR